MGSVEQDKLSLTDFNFSQKGEVVTCPQGNPPVKVKKKKRLSIGFALQDCENCSNLSKCPVKKGKKYYYLRFTDKEMRIAKRRIKEQSDKFKNRYRWPAGVDGMTIGNAEFLRPQEQGPAQAAEIGLPCARQDQFLWISF